MVRGAFGQRPCRRRSVLPLARQLEQLGSLGLATAFGRLRALDPVYLLITFRVALKKPSH